MNYPFNPEWGLLSRKLFPVPIVCTDFVSCLLSVFGVILKLLTWFSGALAVIMFIWAGILLITDPKKAEEVKSRLIWGSLGLALALISWALVKFIENVVATGIIGLFLINFAYAQQLQFTPGKLGCVGVDILGVLRGKGIPAGLFGQCLLWLGMKILAIIYTVSLLLAIGFIIYGGIKLYTKPGDREGWNYVTWALIGGIITILAYSLVRAIEFSLTH